MSFFLRRRIRNTSLVLLSWGLAAFWATRVDASLGHAALGTGYLLFVLVAFLTTYHLRKKLPVLPLGNSSTWLQWHIYVALLSAGVFALHTGLRRPTGVLETSLGITYLLTFCSGLLGLYFSRSIPRQLARLGREVVYERIPTLRREVSDRASSAVLASVAASGETTLAEFFAARLFDFFALPRGWRYQLRPSSAGRRGLLSEMRDLRRYLSAQEQSACEELFALVRRKDELDFHEARQWLLKAWLFVHVGLTYSLLLLAVLHALVVHAFQGGAP